MVLYTLTESPVLNVCPGTTIEPVAASAENTLVPTVDDRVIGLLLATVTS